LTNARFILITKKTKERKKEEKANEAKQPG
jgi:hypothetical protein